MRLYHYTCSHSAPLITRDGFLRPATAVPGFDLAKMPPGQEWLATTIWLTDLEVADRVALGLTSHTIRCDRTAHRVTVDTDQAVHWPVYARAYRLDRATRAELEGHTGALPMHWWVATDPVPIVEVA